MTPDSRTVANTSSIVFNFLLERTSGQLSPYPPPASPGLYYCCFILSSAKYFHLWRQNVYFNRFCYCIFWRRYSICKRRLALSSLFAQHFKWFHSFLFIELLGFFSFSSLFKFKFLSSTFSLSLCLSVWCFFLFPQDSHRLNRYTVFLTEPGKHYTVLQSVCSIWQCPSVCSVWHFFSLLSVIVFW